MISTPDAVAAITANQQALVTALGFAREAYAELASEYEQYRADHPDEPPPPTTERVLLDVDFAGYPKGPFTQAMARDAFGLDDPPSDSWWADKGVTIATSDGRSVLSVKLAAGEMGGGSGPVLFAPIEPTPDITYAMEMQFAPGFDYDMGGKLPGFGTTTDPNVNPPTGGAEPTTGNSCRHMWRTGGEAKDRPPGSAAAYTYHPSYDGTWGEYEFLERVLPIDAYSVVTTHARVNTPGQSDGVLQSRVGEGPWTLDLDDYEWVPPDGDPAAWLFNRFAFAVFRGGSEPEWAASTDGSVQFRRFRITAPA